MFKMGQDQLPQQLIQPSAPSAGVQPSVSGEQQSQAPNGGLMRRLPLKWIFVVLLVLVVLVGGFFAVRFFSSSNSKTSRSQDVVLTYWGLEDAGVFEGLISQYEVETGVKVNYIQQSEKDYRERLVNSLARGSGPDIFTFHNTWVPMFSSYLGVMPSEVMSPAAYKEMFFPVVLRDLQVGSGFVGVPLGIDGLGLYINQDMFREASLSVPTTWDDLRRVAVELTKRDEESGRIVQAGVALGSTRNVDNWQDILALMMLQNGVDLAVPTDELAEDALAFFTIFIREDEVWSEALPSSTEFFTRGQLAMYFGPSWRAKQIREQNPALSFKVVPVPQLPKVSPADVDVNWASYWVEGVWSGSGYGLEAWEFLRFLSEKSQLEVAFGNLERPYPRQDMVSLLADDRFLGAYVKQAQTGKSWYLASGTNDGSTGINSRISGYFAAAVDDIIDNSRDPGDVLEGLGLGVSGILAEYGIF